VTDYNPFPVAAPDFSDPLGLLRACHGRIAAHCDTLERLLPHLAAHGADAEAREAMARVYRYFSTAAAHHHEDEEQDLLPRLRGLAPDLDRLMEELLAEHGQLARNWNELKPLLADPARAAAEQAALHQAVARFVAGYRHHADKENRDLLPRAAQLLDAEALAAIGAAMARRRL
jgi:hemerythrin-like domain-containing protein